MDTSIKKKLNIPDGYVMITPNLEIKPRVSITMTTSGLLRINNLYQINSFNQSFSDISIYFSKKEQRYHIKANVQRAYSIQDIIKAHRNINYHIPDKTLLEVLDLNPDEFRLSYNRTLYDLQYDRDIPANKLYFSRKIQKRTWECPNYIIIG